MPLPYTWPGLAASLGSWGATSHLGMVMAAVAVLYPLLGRLAKSSRRRCAVTEVDYMRPTVEAVAQVNGATRYEIEYSREQPFVTVRLFFPDLVAESTCRDGTYETAILAALGHAVQRRRESLRDSELERVRREGAERAAASARASATAGASAGAGRSKAGPAWRERMGTRKAGSAKAARVSSVIDDDTPWHEVLGVHVSAGKREINAAFKTLANRFHPDHGGSASVMVQVNRARAEGLRGL